MSRLKVDDIRQTGASSDAISLDASGNTTINGNLTVNGTYPGVVLKKTYLEIPRNTCTQTFFPHDDTAPQITEGAEVWSGNYTPSTASCDLYITAHFSQSEQANNGDAQSCALFVSGTNDALQVRSHYTSSSGWEHNHAMSFIYKMASWGTTQKTFSIRFGGGDSINYAYPGTGASGSYYSADACKTGFVIEEIAT